MKGLMSLLLVLGITGVGYYLGSYGYKFCLTLGWFLVIVNGFITSLKPKAYDVTTLWMATIFTIIGMLTYAYYWPEGIGFIARLANN